jgi:hypothetical protein
LKNALAYYNAGVVAVNSGVAMGSRIQGGDLLERKKFASG